MSIEKGRRRGKRQVEKKVRTKDEQGFLVTETQKVWESFSESEPEEPAAKLDKPVTASRTNSTESNAKDKKKKTAANQKSITSFFKK